jgi:hypothetical protein
MPPAKKWMLPTKKALLAAVLGLTGAILIYAALVWALVELR